MSKKSRRKQAAERSDTDPATATPSFDPAASTAVADAPSLLPGPFAKARRFLVRLAGRRKTWLVVVCLLGWAGVLIYNNVMPGTRPGHLEFSSEEPDAQVLIQKEGGAETPIERTAKTTLTLEPGHYSFRLAVPNDNLKLWPTQVNLDPNGGGFIKLRKISSGS